MQALPYPAGFAGVPAEQEPLHSLVPALVVPHAFAAEVQAVPYPAGFAGVEAEHEPLHWIEPELREPHAL